MFEWRNWFNIKSLVSCVLFGNYIWFEFFEFRFIIFVVFIDFYIVEFNFYCCFGSFYEICYCVFDVFFCYFCRWKVMVCNFFFFSCFEREFFICFLWCCVGVDDFVISYLWDGCVFSMLELCIYEFFFFVNCINYLFLVFSLSLME